MPGTLRGQFMGIKELPLDPGASDYNTEQQEVQTFGVGTSEVRVLGKKKKEAGMASGLP